MGNLSLEDTLFIVIFPMELEDTVKFNEPLSTVLFKGESIHCPFILLPSIVPLKIFLTCESFLSVPIHHKETPYLV